MIDDLRALILHARPWLGQALSAVEFLAVGVVIMWAGYEVVVEVVEAVRCWSRGW